MLASLCRACTWHEVPCKHCPTTMSWTCTTDLQSFSATTHDITFWEVGTLLAAAQLALEIAHAIPTLRFLLAWVWSLNALRSWRKNRLLRPRGGLPAHSSRGDGSSNHCVIIDWTFCQWRRGSKTWECPHRCRRHCFGNNKLVFHDATTLEDRKWCRWR